MIQYPFGPMVMEDCDRIYTMLLQTFGTREKLDYMLFYAGAALSGRSPSQSCSCMFSVGRGGCGKTTFINLIKAAVTDAYYTDLPLDSFDNMKTANRVFSVISPCVRFLFASELNKAPKKASILKTICDGEISCTRLFANGSFNMKVNAKLMGTSNNAIMFDEDDTGIARRVQYCLHENQFVDDDELVDGVHVFKKAEFDSEAVSLQDRLAMFHLIAHHAAIFDGDSMAVRPEGVHNGDTLFNMKAFVAEYFVIEAGAKVAKDHVVQLARTFFSHLEFNEDYIIKKLLKFKAQPYITHSANRTHEGCRNILVNIRLNDKHKPSVVDAEVRLYCAVLLSYLIALFHRPTMTLGASPLPLHRVSSTSLRLVTARASVDTAPTTATSRPSRSWHSASPRTRSRSSARHSRTPSSPLRQSTTRLASGSSSKRWRTWTCPKARE